MNLKVCALLLLLFTTRTITPPAAMAGLVTKHPATRTDTLPKRTSDTRTPVLLNVTVDTATPETIWLAPSPTGDDYLQLQAAINYQTAHPGIRIMLRNQMGAFSISKPLLAANRQGGDYGQVKLDIEGAVSARNTPNAATIRCLFNGGFALGVQNCKGCTIRNIDFIGTYNFPSTLNVLQIDTLAFYQWPDTAGGGSRTSPFAGICIDPFSDPTPYDGRRYKKYKGFEGYYLPGMGQGGSTAIDIDGCQITNFVIGLMITPSMQANGELINLSESRIDQCKVAYAYSQAQSKANGITDLMVWGGVHTIIDGMSYGFPRGDASTAPMVDRMNIAGYNHQLLNISAASFPVTINRVYGESLFKIGFVDIGTAGVHFSDWQIDFQNGIPGIPSPDTYYYGLNTTWTACMLRLYNGKTTQRIVFSPPFNVFRDGVMGSPPVCATLNPSLAPPTFEHTTLYYENGMLNRNDYDSLVYIGTMPIAVDRSTFNGYLLTGNKGVAVGDLLAYQAAFVDQYQMAGGVMAAGFVTGIKADTVFLQNIGQGIHNGGKLDVYDCKIKRTFKIR